MVKGSPVRKRMAVAVAGDEHTLQAVMHARKEGIIAPVLVGDKKVIDEILSKMGETVPEEDIFDVADPKEACEKAVALIREGHANFLMKGRVDTSVILKAVVNKEHGLGKGGVMSHFTMFEIPTYHKLLVPVDGGMVTYPTLEQKKAIIDNTVGTLRSMGYECPKVGVLACVEKVNPKMPETVEARKLQEMNAAGEIKNCIVEGPISYDCAISKEIADLKGLNSRIAGDVDVLLAPNIHAGNIMGKMLTVTCKAKLAGFIVGAKCPIVLTSRGSSAEEKFLSIVISAAAAEHSIDAKGATAKKGEKILVINPGSTSTKIALYNGSTRVWMESLTHTQEELAKYPTVFDQLDMRKELILDCMKKHNDEISSLAAVVSRGGCLPPVSAGAYEVNDYMVDCLHYHPQDQHASNVGAAIALDLARAAGVKAYIYDALTVDEMDPINTITGLKGIRWPSRGHNLNTRAAALKVCHDKNISYNESTLVVAHLGGGITINLHHNGRIVDVVMDEEGPMCPERAGGLPTYALVELAYSGKYTKTELKKLLERKGGMCNYFGTVDMREVEAMINAGNKEAELVFNAMALATAKNIAKISAYVCGKVDYIVLTGGLAYSKRFVDCVTEHVSFIAPVVLVPGENEMDALANGALRVLRGQEQAKLMTPEA